MATLAHRLRGNGRRDCAPPDPKDRIKDRIKARIKPGFNESIPVTVPLPIVPITAPKPGGTDSAWRPALAGAGGERV
jgi:hypothetical protein